MSVPSSNENEVLVTTSDGELYNVTYDLANQMGAIKTKLATLGDPYFIPLEHIESDTFELVLKWCKSLQDLNTTLNVDTSRTIFNDLVQEFNIEHNMMYKLTVAAHNLDILSLKDAAIQRLADELKDCTSAEDMRLQFGIPDDYQFDDNNDNDEDDDEAFGKLLNTI